MIITGLLDNKEDVKEMKFIAKLVVVGNRARLLAQEANKNDGNNLE